MTCILMGDAKSFFRIYVKESIKMVNCWHPLINDIIKYSLYNAMTVIIIVNIHMPIFLWYNFDLWYNHDFGIYSMHECLFKLCYYYLIYPIDALRLISSSHNRFYFHCFCRYQLFHFKFVTIKQTFTSH